MSIRKAVVWFGASLLAVQITSNPVPGMAHKTQISGNVGGTAHIEPNDNPQAGTPSLVWFALARQGGELIPLEDCNCKLSLYAQPRQPDEAAVAQPSLKPVSTEGYQNIPGADVTFPQVGAYNLVLQGEPTTPNDFAPFELTFDVTVAVGQSTATSDVTPTATTAPSSIATAPAPHHTSAYPFWLFWAVPIGILAIGLPLLLRRKQ